MKMKRKMMFLWMIAEMIWEMICVMVMVVFDDYYCLVLMNPMGPGVMYVMFVVGQLC